MNLELTEEQLALRDTLHAFLAKNVSVSGHLRPLLDDPRGTTDEVWQGLARLGVTGLLVPEEFGGAGLPLADTAVVLAELGAALYSGPWLSTAVAAPRALIRFGAGESAAALFRGMADGSVIATVGPLDPAQPRPRVDTGSSGTPVLRGRLEAVPDACAADVLLVFAEGPEGNNTEGNNTEGNNTEGISPAGIGTPGISTEGIGLYAVRTVDPAVTVRGRPTVDLTRRCFDVELAGAPGALLATGALRDLESVRDDVLAARATDAVGAARAVTGLVVEYAKSRQQFGRPIGSFQAVQHLCVDMFEIVELAYGGALYALWAADSADDRSRTGAVLHAKAYSGCLASVGDRAIQVLGGIGYTSEHNAHLYLRRLLGWSAYLGGADRYLEQVGERLVAPYTAITP
ncbi:acyl-CoA dehydrogenase family protein [Nocardia sp. NPDC024068]|uniref:acyl-CoA dehydrogenase family protein n=1 Tax=Nocardia sp. NPDC024068 TaxID=3157197 RepID=UPI00340D8EB5